MLIAESKLTSQGQISVPAEIRRRLGLVKGSVIEWQEDGDNIVVKSPKQYSFEDMHERLFPVKPEPKTLDELKEGIRNYIRKKHARS